MKAVIESGYVDYASTMRSERFFLVAYLSLFDR